jgi:hypothetical protein
LKLIGAYLTLGPGQYASTGKQPSDDSDANEAERHTKE